MEKTKLEKYLKENKSFNQISKEEKKSLTTIRYWMKKYNLTSKFDSIRHKEIIEYGEQRFCPRCKSLCDVNNFYNRRGKKNASVYCKNCTNNQTKERQQNVKKQMIDYKGGKCELCQYSNYQGALEFHHLDPNEKDFNLSNLKSYKFDDVIKKELDKCVLVCANCHREIHGNLIKV
jgi:transposase